MFHGSLVALVTPFDGNNRVDYSSLKRLVDFHVEQGSSAIVVAGTTGESPTLERSEHIELIGRAIEIADGRIPVIAGTGSNSTSQSIELSLAVADPRIAAYMAVVPYYNKPTQEGLFRHYTAIADALRAGCGCRRLSTGHTVLQQADPGRPFSASQGDC